MSDSAAAAGAAAAAAAATPAVDAADAASGGGVATKSAPITVVVTGASSGIGLELVTLLAARGDKVFATVRKLQSSQTGKDLISAVPGDVTIIEGVDVAKDTVGDVFAASPLAGVTIDAVIHNAGTMNASRSVAANKIMDEQSLENITMDRMRATFEVNTLGPLRVQKALQAQMKSPGGKVAVISTGLASIGDNTSGGKYAYRVSKAAVNMVTKCFACDMKKAGISVVAIAPGFVATEFGPGLEALKKWGGKPVSQAGEGIIATLDAMSLENTGEFRMVTSSTGEVKSFLW